VESGGGPPHSKTLARFITASEMREASWSAPVLWHFSTGEIYPVVNHHRCVFDSSANPFYPFQKL
jgi:hypothetical protein